MKRSTKAVLLSAFIFPGVGHIYLKKYIPGITLVFVSFAVISYLVSKSVEIALEISDKIQSGNLPLDAVSIAGLVSQQIAGTESQLLNIATYVFIICWLIGAIDSYRAGRVRDKNDEMWVNK